MNRASKAVTRRGRSQPSAHKLRVMRCMWAFRHTRVNVWMRRRARRAIANHNRRRGVHRTCMRRSREQLARGVERTQGIATRGAARRAAPPREHPGGLPALQATGRVEAAVAWPALRATRVVRCTARLLAAASGDGVRRVRDDARVDAVPPRARSAQRAGAQAAVVRAVRAPARSPRQGPVGRGGVVRAAPPSPTPRRALTGHARHQIPATEPGNVPGWCYSVGVCRL